MLLFAAHRSRDTAARHDFCRLTRENFRRVLACEIFGAKLGS
jgi:hypothetical protein